MSTRRRTKKLRLQVEWENRFEFRYREDSNIKVKGHIDEKQISKFNHTIFNTLKETIDKIGSDPIEEKEYIKKKVDKENLANFAFIRSIFDYANIAPSRIFSQTLIDIYQASPHLFEPASEFWDDLLQQSDHQRKRILSLPILKLAGLFRSPFRNLANHWISIIEFLRNTCNNDASVFLKSMSGHLGIDLGDEYALEKTHESLKNKQIKERVGIHFPYGDKNGRLLFSIMSKSNRGLGVLEGVTDEHLKNFNIPVDSQIIRVGFNSGLIRITRIDAKSFKFKEKEKHGRGLLMTRSDFTEPCQLAWKLIAEKLNVFPVDLDHYVWSLGSILCKRYGELCYMCPLTEICWSREKGSVAESRGAKWQEGCFSFGRAQPGIDRLIVRTCAECPCYIIDVHMNKTCNRSENYKVHVP